MQVNIHETYSVVIIALPREQKNDSSMEMLEKWVKTWLVPGDELIHLYTNNYVVLKKKAPPLLTTDEKFVEFMEQKAKNLPFNNPMITVGPFSEGIVGWRQSFQTAKTMKETAEALYPQGGVWDQNKLGLATLCYRFLKETNKDSLAMIDRYRRLLSDNDGEELQRTFLTYLEENGEMAKTAEKLFIHRNTLSYRLEKIHIITGKNPKNLLDLLELKLGQLLYSLAAKQ